MTARQATDDLIRELAGRPVQPPFSARRTVLNVLVAMVLPLALFLLTFGLRADLAEAMLRLPVLAKTILPLVACMLATGLALVSGRPARRVDLWPLAVPVLAGLALVALRLAEGPQAALPELIGQSAVACMASITLMSALPLWVGLRTLQHAAPTRPGLTGALLGLAVGAGVASGYAMYCTEDSPLFFMAWYVLAILAVVGVGAVLGRRTLRW